MGSGLTTTGNSSTGGTVCTGTGGAGNVGRFIPDHFNTAIVTSATAPIGCGTGLTCPTLYNGMVYSGQLFSVLITAKNASDNTTVNYDSTLTPSFAKTVTLAPYGSLGAATSPTGAGALAATIEATFGSGTFTETAEKYTFTTSPTLPTNIYIRATDTDSVPSMRSTNPTTTSIEGGIAVVSGRTKISNAYGSELLPLAMTSTAQFYNASGNWVTSKTDSLTSYSTSTNLVASIINGPLASITVKNAGTITMSSGLSIFTLNAPGNGISGSADIGLSAPSYLPSVSGRATFGVYKGNNSIIYMRENY
jgi:MSHA biogenesis protein MshQ